MKKVLLFTLSTSLVLFACAPAEEAEDAAPAADVVVDEAAAVLQRGVAPVILIVDPALRKPLSDIFKKFNLDIVVLSHAEVDPNAKFEVLGAIDIEDL